MIRSMQCIFLGISCLVLQNAYAVVIAQGVNQDLLDACPSVWESVNIRILTSEYPTDVWQGNVTDKGAFKTFMQTKMGVSAPDAAGLEAMANDILTVAAECAVQRVRYLDALLREIPKDVLASMDSISAVLGAVGATSTGPDIISWIDDGLPAGAVAGGSWNWVSNNPTPRSGSRAHKSLNMGGPLQHLFYNATETFQIGVGDTIVVDVYLDPVDPPSQVQVQWNVNGSWEHRAYWGANLITLGIEGTNSHRNMGALPITGKWVRLQIPANLVGLEGKAINGMAFDLSNGQAIWDVVGKISN